MHARNFFALKGKLRTTLLFNYILAAEALTCTCSCATLAGLLLVASRSMVDHIAFLDQQLIADTVVTSYSVVQQLAIIL